MSDLSHQHSNAQPQAAESAKFTAQEQLPDASGVGRAQRSEPERSDGERSGARPPLRLASGTAHLLESAPPAWLMSSAPPPQTLGRPSPSSPAPPGSSAGSAR